MLIKAKCRNQPDTVVRHFIHQWCKKPSCKSTRRDLIDRSECAAVVEFCTCQVWSSTTHYISFFTARWEFYRQNWITKDTICTQKHSDIHYLCLVTCHLETANLQTTVMIYEHLADHFPSWIKTNIRDEKWSCSPATAEQICGVSLQLTHKPNATSHKTTKIKTSLQNLPKENLNLSPVMDNRNSEIVSDSLCVCVKLLWKCWYKWKNHTCEREFTHTSHTHKQLHFIYLHHKTVAHQLQR